MRIERFQEGTLLALDQLRGNKSRSVLTILGIVIGVAVVMAMSAMIAGVRTSILSAIEGAGPLNFDVMRYDPFGVHVEDGHGPPWGRNPAITMQEAARLATLSKVKGAVPIVSAQEDMTYQGQRAIGVGVRGMGAGWENVFGATILTGHDFLPADVEAAHPVALISEGLAQDLFGTLDPLGRRFRAGGQSFEVIGTIKLPDNLMQNTAKDFALVPVSAAIKYLDASKDFIVIEVTPAAGIPQQDAMDQVTVTLRTMRGLRPAEPNNFALIRADQIVQQFNKLTAIFFLVMIALSSVGLMVGGVGVIAIMMIAVTERTREIGIRKALGATQHEILFQFLIESVTVTFIGAAIGMAIGAALAFTAAHLTPIPARVPLMAVVAALGMAAVAGVLFGLIPAWRAARLDPVVALRYE